MLASNCHPQPYAPCLNQGKWVAYKVCDCTIKITIVPLIYIVGCDTFLQDCCDLLLARRYKGIQHAIYDVYQNTYGLHNGK